MNFNNQSITITNKSEIKITELQKLNSFNDKEFSITTSIGDILISGSNLEMDNINQDTNELVIKGNISEIMFDHIHEKEKRKKEQSFIRKIFK